MRPRTDIRSRSGRSLGRSVATRAPLAEMSRTMHLRSAPPVFMRATMYTGLRGSRRRSSAWNRCWSRQPESRSEPDRLGSRSMGTFPIVPPNLPRSRRLRRVCCLSLKRIGRIVPNGAPWAAKQILQSLITKSPRLARDIHTWMVLHPSRDHHRAAEPSRQAAVRTGALSRRARSHSSVVVVAGSAGPASASAPNARHSASIAASNSFTGAGRDSGSRRYWSMKKSYATSEGTWARTSPSLHLRRSHWFATTRLRASAASQLNTC
jgi:hypothetical protein